MAINSSKWKYGHISRRVHTHFLFKFLYVLHYVILEYSGTGGQYGVINAKNIWNSINKHVKIIEKNRKKMSKNGAIKFVVKFYMPLRIKIERFKYKINAILRG